MRRKAKANVDSEKYVPQASGVQQNESFDSGGHGVPFDEARGRPFVIAPRGRDNALSLHNTVLNIPSFDGTQDRPFDQAQGE